MFISRAALRAVVDIANGPRRFGLDRCSAVLHRFTIALDGCSAALGRFFSDLHPPMARLRRRTAVVNACMCILSGRSAQVCGQTGRCSGTMTTVPRTDNAAISFFTSHLNIWEQDPGQVGLSPQEIAAMRALVEAAAAARLAAAQAREAAMAATSRMRLAITQMRKQGALAIGRIRAFAAQEGSNAPVIAAALDVPSTRRTPLPPARPEQVQTSVASSGAIRLKWKVRHTQETRAGGSVYTIERREMRSGGGGGGPGPWTMIGATNGGGTSQSFIDEAPPTPHSTTPHSAAGAISGVAYRITARRAGIIGPSSDIVTVSYGGGNSPGAAALGTAAISTRAG